MKACASEHNSRAPKLIPRKTEGAKKTNGYKKYIYLKYFFRRSFSRASHCGGGTLVVDICDVERDGPGAVQAEFEARRRFPHAACVRFLRYVHRMTRRAPLSLPFARPHEPTCRKARAAARGLSPPHPAPAPPLPLSRRPLTLCAPSLSLPLPPFQTKTQLKASKRCSRGSSGSSATMWRTTRSKRSTSGRRWRPSRRMRS